MWLLDRMANSGIVYYGGFLGGAAVGVFVMKRRRLNVSIYTDVVNTSVQQTVIIPITGAPNGTYTLVLENTTGYAEGEFNKEP